MLVLVLVSYGDGLLDSPSPQARRLPLVGFLRLIFFSHPQLDDTPSILNFASEYAISKTQENQEKLELNRTHILVCDDVSLLGENIHKSTIKTRKLKR
jgi:hypothetical protein